MTDREEKLVDSHYAASYLGIATQTLATWRARGIGPAYVFVSPAGKTKAAIRYRLSELQAFHTQWRIAIEKAPPTRNGVTRNEHDRYPFIRGFAGALADAMRLGLPMGDARRVMEARTLTVAHATAAGVPTADLKWLTRAMRSPLTPLKPDTEPLGAGGTGRGRKPRPSRAKKPQ